MIPGSDARTLSGTQSLSARLMFEENGLSTGLDCMVVLVARVSSGVRHLLSWSNILPVIFNLPYTVSTIIQTGVGAKYRRDSLPYAS
jgi:hypothetical protein